MARLYNGHVTFTLMLLVMCVLHLIRPTYLADLIRQRYWRDCFG
ncbi:MAG: hypothetical protein RIM23_05070 [Coleofasciculus sp. G3-WIS-01]